MSTTENGNRYQDANSPLPAGFSPFASEQAQDAPQTIGFDAEDQARWKRLAEHIQAQFGLGPKLEALILLVGMNEVGVLGPELEKETKMDLMHVGLAMLLAQEGYYELERWDEDGWPHFTMLAPQPHLDLFSQTNWLRKLLLRYFADKYELEADS